MEPAPKHTIAQIEQELQRARFSELDSEKYLRSRHERKALEQASKTYRQKDRQLAFLAGYRAASDRMEFMLVPWAVAALGIVAVLNAFA